MPLLDSGGASGLEDVLLLITTKQPLTPEKESAFMQKKKARKGIFFNNFFFFSVFWYSLPVFYSDETEEGDAVVVLVYPRIV